MKCAECAKENAPEAAFCGGCGAKLTPGHPLTFDLDLSAAAAPAPPASFPPPAQAAPPNNPHPQPAPSAAPPAGLYLVCAVGPDAGKRIALGKREITLGRSEQCGLLSDDPDVSETHVGFVAQNDLPHFRSLSPAPVFVDGAPYTNGVLSPANQVRVGRSFWQIEAPAAKTPTAVSLFDRVNERVSVVTGVSKVEGFNAQEMFSSVLEPRTDDEIEDYFLTGTSATTPALNEISAVWPKPWVFFKTFTFSLLIYLGFYFAWNQFHAPTLLPGLITMGAFAIPISVVIFYFEMNAPRNVSIYQVFKLLFTGGILSLIGTLFLDTILRGGTGNIVAAMLTGVAEESGKVLALLLVVHKIKYRWTLNGLLFGGAVGAGFAGFETSGYSFIALMQTLSDTPVFQTIFLRGLLAPGGHVAWTALCGAALWKVKGNDRFRFAMFQDIRFLRVFGLAIVLHGLWDTNIPLPFFLKEVALSGIAWIAILSLVQDGLKQIQTAQAQRAAEGASE